MADDKTKGKKAKTEKDLTEGKTVESGWEVQKPERSSTVQVALQPTHIPLTEDLALWVVIRNSTEAISFEKYKEFITPLMCGQNVEKIHNGQETVYTPTEAKEKGIVPFPRVDNYKLLKGATEIFLMEECGVALENFLNPNFVRIDSRTDKTFSDFDLQRLWRAYLEGVNGTGMKTIPYLALIREKLGEVPLKDEEASACYGILQEKLTRPCFLELIWCYWHEEGMLEQTMNAISLRFQNKRRVAGRDPLAHLDIDPLRSLNNLFWGYIQDEQHRLHLQRRAYEYNHEYGLTLYGKAVPLLQPVDSRSKFIEAFHNLLHQCAIFFAAEDDTMVIADGFPILNALQEVHLLLAQGAHNQYGDLPWTARMEMLMQQWLLARPEMREFLGRRIMMPYPEAWMDRVDTVKQLHGWTDVSIINFNVLAKCGEQILLSIRFGNWSRVIDRDNAANWARFWRAEIQGYIHNYRVVTGVDLTTEPVDTTLPSVHLRRRLAERLKELPRGRQVGRLSTARQRRQSPRIHAPVHAELFE